MNAKTQALIAAAVAEERERLAELMERQHTWISSASASRLIRGNTAVLMHGYVDPFQVEPVAWRVCVDGIWFHARDRDGLMAALGAKLGRALYKETPEPLYAHPADRRA
jgi:hypothetical protein